MRSASGAIDADHDRDRSSVGVFTAHYGALRRTSSRVPALRFRIEMPTPFADITHLIDIDDADEIEAALAETDARGLTRLARAMLWHRAGECIELLRECSSCSELLASGGYDPVHLLTHLRSGIGRREANMDIAPEGRGGAQRDQGYGTWIRFGAREFLTGTALAGMSVPESQRQVILHELAHAAGDVIPPDGGDPQESVRNQHRITRLCLPDVYRRTTDEQGGAHVAASTAVTRFVRR